MHTLQIVERGTPLPSASKAVVLLHGRGGSAQDIVHLGDALVDDGYYIVAPQAANNTWYPFSFMAPEQQNEPWLTSAVAIVHNLLAGIEQNIPATNIIVAGFSQGACLTLESIARSAKPYKAIIAFTGGLIGASLHEERYKGDLAGTKMLITNSQNDPHVPLARSTESKTILEKMGANVQLSVFQNRPHTILPDELAQARQLIAE